MFWYDAGGMTNHDVAELLRKVAAAYQVLNVDRFRIIAYERAADSIEHLTSEAKNLWDDEKLETIPGVGASLTQHLDELFRTGKVRHFDEVMSKVPSSIFPLLSIPGIGSKKAFKLVKDLHLEESKHIVSDIEKAAKEGKIAQLEGFGEKSQEDILSGIEAFRKGQIKENRMVLSEADAVAMELLDYMKKISSVTKIDVLGSLRRRVATIGDIDISVSTREPERAIDHFVSFPHNKLIERGPTGASLLLNNGRQVDLRVQEPESYGAMLQYFTGSKNHNIKLRSLALEHGLSLNEYGMKNVKTGKLTKYNTEKSLYNSLSMDLIPPELREDKGEIETALKRKLPNLVEESDVRGDLHIHANYDLKSSHDVGQNTLEDHFAKAETLGYSYIGISDHNPSITNHSPKEIVSIMKMRKEYYEQISYSYFKNKKNRVHLFIMCEVDILTDGALALPEEAFEYVDAVIVSLHSSFTQERKQMTARVRRALRSHPKVKIFGHPTGRLLGKREGVELDWDVIFDNCKKHSIALEINAYPERLDLPDSIVYDARVKGIKFCIDTDSHAVEHMTLMKYGVWVARRGWAEKSDIVNTMEYNHFKEWLTGSRQY